MIITLNLNGRKLKRIRKYVHSNNLESINEFINISIDNQLELEENTGLEVTLQQNNEPSYLTFKNNANILMMPETLKIDLVEVKEKDINSRNLKPFWSIKNKFFPTKFILRIIYNILINSNKNEIDIKVLKDKIKYISQSTRDQLENLDKKMGKKRGSKFSTGFPKNNEKSYERFFKSFLISRFKRKNDPRGLSYEMGFIQIKNGKIKITKSGYEFLSMYSPIIDGYLINFKKPNSIFSDEELLFLYEYLGRIAPGEIDAYKLISNEIMKGNNTTESLSLELKNYLENNYGNENFSASSVDSLRSSIISRMVELSLATINKNGLKSYYNINDKYFVKFKEVI